MLPFDPAGAAWIWACVMFSILATFSIAAQMCFEIVRADRLIPSGTDGLLTARARLRLEPERTHRAFAWRYSCVSMSRRIDTRLTTVEDTRTGKS